MNTTTEERDEIIHHLANTSGYDQEVMEAKNITMRELNSIMLSGGYEKCDCGLWTHEALPCRCEDGARERSRLYRVMPNSVLERWSAI